MLGANPNIPFLSNLQIIKALLFCSPYQKYAFYCLPHECIFVSSFSAVFYVRVKFIGKNSYYSIAVIFKSQISQKVYN